jgi:hypothetical protein
MDDGYTGYEVQQWCKAIAHLHAGEVRREVAPDVQHGVAMPFSAWGFQAAPIEVLQMMANAMEIGYARALEDVRDGKYDREVRAWRPDLAED